MLTLVKQQRGANAYDASIRLPDTTMVADVERFCRLAAIFHGHHSPDGAFIFTEMRGRKCMKLYEAGFDALKQYGKADRRCIRHQSTARPFRVAEALDLCGVIGGAVKAEAW